MKYIFPFFKMDAANADGTTTGGSSGETTTTTTTNDSTTPSEADQLKEQLAKQKKDNAALALKISENEKNLEKLRVNSQKTNGEYKALYEESEKKVVLLEEKTKTLTESIFHTSRVSAVKDAAVKLGLRSAALSDLEGMDLDEVGVNVGDDKIIRVEGAQDFASKLKTLKPYLFETPKDLRFNGGGGGGGNTTGATVNDEQLQAAYRQRNVSPEKMKAYQDARKSYDEQTRKAKTK